MAQARTQWKDRLVDMGARGALALARLLPYRWRVPLFGALCASVVAPLAGHPARIRAHLDYAWPTLDGASRKMLTRAVPDNMGRSLIELYSPDDFGDTVSRAQVRGDGWSAIEQARSQGQPVILVSGHIGNYDAVRTAMVQRGLNVGSLFRQMSNPFFNEHYETAMRGRGPMFPKGRRGMTQMIRHLRDNGVLAIVSDQYVHNGAELTFFGKPALTALSAAELALKYNALLIPAYGLRQPDGLNFDVVLETPVPHTDAETMTQALNDSLEDKVRRYPGQWLWNHRRWRP